MGYEITDENDWRLSRNGYDIKQGWSNNSRIVCSYRGDTLNIEEKKFEQWIEDAELICTLYNAHRRNNDDGVCN